MILDIKKVGQQIWFLMRDHDARANIFNTATKYRIISYVHFNTKGLKKGKKGANVNRDNGKRKINEGWVEKSTRGGG